MVLANMAATGAGLAQPIVHIGMPAAAALPGLVIAPLSDLPLRLSASVNARLDHLARQAQRSEGRGRGWALYQKGDWDGAKQVFTNLDGGSYSQEREEGLRVTNSSLTPSRFR